MKPHIYVAHLYAYILNNIAIYILECFIFLFFKCFDMASYFFSWVDSSLFVFAKCFGVGEAHCSLVLSYAIAIHMGCETCEEIMFMCHLVLTEKGATWSRAVREAQNLRGHIHHYLIIICYLIILFLSRSHVIDAWPNSTFSSLSVPFLFSIIKSSPQLLQKKNV